MSYPFRKRSSDTTANAAVTPVVKEEHPCCKQDGSAKPLATSNVPTTKVQPSATPDGCCCGSKQER